MVPAAARPKPEAPEHRCSRAPTRIALSHQAGLTSTRALPEGSAAAPVPAIRQAARAIPLEMGSGCTPGPQKCRFRFFFFSRHPLEMGSGCTPGPQNPVRDLRRWDPPIAEGHRGGLFFCSRDGAPPAPRRFQRENRAAPAQKHHQIWHSDGLGGGASGHFRPLYCEPPPLPAIPRKTRNLPQPVDAHGHARQHCGEQTGTRLWSEGTSVRSRFARSATSASTPVVAYCNSCRHSSRLGLAELRERYGPDLSLKGLRARLRCSRCGGRSVEVFHVWDAGPHSRGS